MNEEYLAEQFGQNLAAIHHGISADAVPGLTGLNKAASEAVETKRALCKAGSILVEAPEGPTTLSVALMELSKEASWESANDFIPKTIARTLGRVSQGLNAEGCVDEMAKEASMVSGAAALTTAARNKGSLALIAALTALTGGGTGAATWLANRSSSEEDADLEVKKARIHTLRKIRKEIEDDLAYSGALETDSKEDDREVIRNYAM